MRRWVAPNDPQVYRIPWQTISSSYNFPTSVLSAIPLDEQAPPANMLVRSFVNGTGRIVSWAAALGQWRHVPNPATFQALQFFCCNVTAADSGFFNRIREGIGHQPTANGVQANYPSCG